MGRRLGAQGGTTRTWGLTGFEEETEGEVRMTVRCRLGDGGLTETRHTGGRGEEQGGPEAPGCLAWH